MLEEVSNSFSLSLNSTSWGFLNKNVSILAMFEGEEYEIYSFFETHDEACHFWLGESNRVAITDLVDPQRNNRTTRAHHITITSAANLGVTTVT